jgi:hypothetical protein
MKISIHLIKSNDLLKALLYFCRAFIASSRCLPHHPTIRLKSKSQVTTQHNQNEEQEQEQADLTFDCEF